MRLNKRSFILVFALVIIMLVVLSLTALFLIAYSDLALAHSMSNSAKAQYIAEAGIVKGLSALRSYVSTPVPTGTFTVPGDTITFSTGNSGSFSVTVVPDLSVYPPRYEIRSTGTYKNAARSISLTVVQVAFFSYAYLSDSEDTLVWGSPIWFVTGDVLNGSVRSNDMFNISGAPIFKGDVTSSAAGINYMHGGPPLDNPDFQKTLTLNAPRARMPQESDITGIVKASAQQAGGKYFNTGITLTLLSNGTMNVKPSGSSVTTNYPLPSNGALYANGPISMSGILNGVLTVGAAQDISITNSILYNTDPRLPAGSGDMLCLASSSNVYINTSAYNIEVDAYIIAYQSFGVYNYAGIPARGILTLYGGVTQDVRGGVGTFYTATGQKATGYTKDYNYDTRLTSMVPAFFPPMRDGTTNQIVYTKVLWEEA